MLWLHILRVTVIHPNPCYFTVTCVPDTIFFYYRCIMGTLPISPTLSPAAAHCCLDICWPLNTPLTSVNPTNQGSF